MENTDNIPENMFLTALAAANLSKPLVEHPDGRRQIILPDGFALHDATDPNRLLDHIQQVVTVDDRSSLVDYANRFSDANSLIIADYDAGKITAYLDWHQDNKNGLAARQNRHSVTLKLRNSEEWSRWNKMEGEMHAQSDFAMFIEENVTDIIDPDHSQMLEICRDLEATQGSAFKSSTRLESGDRKFTYETETHIRGDISVPTEIKLLIPLYNGEEPVEVRAKFRFKATPQGLVLGFRWHRVEYQRMATFFEMARLAADETGLPVFNGRCA